MKQILVVGSDPKISQDLDRYLDSKEFKLLVHPQGKSMITYLTKDEPDLIILDLDPMGQSGLEIIQKIRELDSDLPLIVLSKNPIYQERAKRDDNYTVFPSPLLMEKIAMAVKEFLSSESIIQEQRIWHGSSRLSSRDNEQIERGSDPNRISSNPQSDNQDYQHIFTQMLGPVFGQIIRDCQGQVYDRLLSGLEKTMISEVLRHVNHNQVKASQLLGISRNTLRERMKRFDIF